MAPGRFTPAYASVRRFVRPTVLACVLTGPAGWGCDPTPPTVTPVVARSAEPDFFYARHEPPAGRVIHGWGQFSSAWAQRAPAGIGDAVDLEAYEQAVAPYAPAMLSFYVAPVPEQVGPFLQRYAEFADARPFFIAQVGLYFQTLQEPVAVGDHDAEIRRLLVGLRDARRPVLLRIGYEFNNPWALYDPHLYIASFRRIVYLARETDTMNVAAVWNASALGLEQRGDGEWYPGDDVVDWWSLNLFHFEEFTSVHTAAFLNEARRRRKPVLIGETSPVLSSGVPGRVRGPTSAAEALRWYGGLFELIRGRPEVKAVSVIAVDWRRLDAHLSGSGWPNARLDAWAGVADFYQSHLASERFLHAEEAAALYSGAEETRAEPAAVVP